MAAAGEIPIDVISYPDIEMAGADWMKTAGGVSRTYDGHFRVAGVKLCLDGSPQGKTAWLTQPYKVPPPGLPADYRGYPAIPDDNVVRGYVESAFVNDWQMVVHDNGDAAIDQYLRVVADLTAQYGPKDRRPVAIHAQVTREDQLDTMKALGVIPTFFATHTFYWGDWHTEQVLGEPRADNISPSGSARRRDMVFTIHNDAPAVPPDAMMLLSAAVNRVTRSGRVIGSDQRISAYDGLRAITIWGAYQHFEENSKGTITVGKLADFAILDSNPVKGDPMRIREINVVETIKEGNTVFTL
jgi:predicted amidohydrolase YtcJ